MFTRGESKAWGGVWVESWVTLHLIPIQNDLVSSIKGMLDKDRETSPKGQLSNNSTTFDHITHTHTQILNTHINLYNIWYDWKI